MVYTKVSQRFKGWIEEDYNGPTLNYPKHDAQYDSQALLVVM